MKRIAREERKSLGQVISERLAPALRTEDKGRDASIVQWRSRPMQPKVDLEDKEAVRAALSER